MNGWLDRLNRMSRVSHATLAASLVLCIGALHYVVGPEMTFSMIYVFPIALGTWFVGERFGLILAALSAIVFTVVDLAAGMQVSSIFVPVWNVVIRFFLFAVLVKLLITVHDFQKNLEARVRDRTSALTQEIATRERLEQEMLDISERERKRIGYDLHDGLGQQLTGAALAVQVVQERIAKRDLPEAADLVRAVSLIEDGIAICRKLAQSLQPVEEQAGGLMEALQRLSDTTTELFKIHCRLDCEFPIVIKDVSTADHLYRISQEAISNSVKHGHAHNIVISLEDRDKATVLSIADDGIGILDQVQSSGLGLKIMAQRARLIGAKLEISRSPLGGTIVTCSLPHTHNVRKVSTPLRRAPFGSSALSDTVPH
jgi:signal transduction histidine kinase